MTPYELIPVAPVVAIVAGLTLAILVLTAQARGRAHDPEIRHGMGWLLVAQGALFCAASALLLRPWMSFSAAAFIVALGTVACFLCGYGGLSRGLGHRPRPVLLALAGLGSVGVIGALLALGVPLPLVLLASSALNGAIVTVLVLRLRQQAAAFGQAQVQLATLPFILILGLYLARLGAAMAGAGDFILTLLTLAMAFTLCFATLAWCFALLAFGMVRLTRSLRAERARAEEANRVKSQFLANMSHEIRTPLNGVLGMAQLLDDRLRDPAEREMLGVVRQCGEDLLAVLNDILDLSKVEAGRFDLDLAAMRPADLIDRIERLYRLRAGEKGIGFTVERGAGLDQVKLGDAGRIVQVLHNLLGNAIKFTAAGQVRLGAGWRDGGTEGILASPGAGWLELTVADTGIGMTAEQLQRVFEDFVQADGSITRRYGGTGLGLALSRRLIGLMGGTIRVESELGVGTRFVVRLPLADAPPGAVGTGPEPPEPVVPGSTGALVGLRLLLAEDNPVNRRVVEAMLAGTGAALTIAVDGRTAVAAALAEGPGFDLLLMDVSMPEVDGPTALRDIRAGLIAAGRPVPPAVALTAHAMTHQIAGFLGDGFAAHLAKPVRRADLLATIRRHAGPAGAIRAGPRAVPTETRAAAGR